MGDFWPKWSVKICLFKIAYYHFGIFCRDSSLHPNVSFQECMGIYMCYSMIGNTMETCSMTDFFFVIFAKQT